MSEESNSQTKDQINILESIKGAQLDLRVMLVEKAFSIGELSHLSPGSVLLFDQEAGAPAELTVNGKRFAEGTVVKTNEHYGLKIDKLH